MSLDVLCQGRLVKSPEVRKAKNGNEYALAQLSVATEADASTLVSVIAFSSAVVKTLQALDVGDAICVAGRAKLTAWADKKSSEPRAGLSITAERVMTAYHLRRKRRAVQEAEDGGDGAEHHRPVENVAQGLKASRTGLPEGLEAMADDPPW